MISETSLPLVVANQLRDVVFGQQPVLSSIGRHAQRSFCMKYLLFFALLCESLLCQSAYSHRISREIRNTVETIGVYPSFTSTIPVAPPNTSAFLFNSCFSRSGEPVNSTYSIIGSTELLLNGRNYSWFDVRYKGIANATQNDICSVSVTGEIVVRYEYLVNKNVVVSLQLFPDTLAIVSNGWRLDCYYEVDIGNDGTMDMLMPNGYTENILSREFVVAVGPNNPLEIGVSIFAQNYTTVRTITSLAESNLRIQVFDGLAPLNPIPHNYVTELTLGINRTFIRYPAFNIELGFKVPIDYDRFYILYGYPLANPVPFPLNPNCNMYLNPAGSKRIYGAETFPCLPEAPGDVVIQGVVRERSTGIWYTTQAYQYNRPPL